MRAVTTIMAFTVFFFSAFTFMLLFNWFPAEIFGMTTLNYAQALGIKMTYDVIRTKLATNYSEEEPPIEHKIGQIIGNFIFYVLLLVIAFVLMPYV